MDAVPKNKRASRAQQVVDVSRRRDSEKGNAQNLNFTRLERGICNGKLTLTAVFAKAGVGEPDRLDLSFMLDFPALVDLFSEGVLRWGRPLSHLSRVNGSKNLSSFWFKYLSLKGFNEISPSRLDEEIMTGFNTWLHQLRKANGKPLHPRSIAQALGAVRSVLRSAPEAGEWLDLVPDGPRGAARKSNPTEVLDFDQLLRVMAAVENEVLVLRDRWETGRQLIEKGRHFLLEGRALCPNPKRAIDAHAVDNIALALAKLDRLYSGVIPDLSVVTKDDPLLARTIQCTIGGKQAAGYFYAGARDLVPLVLSVAVATVFNPDTVLNMCWGNIDRKVNRMGNGRSSLSFDVTDEEVGVVEEAELDSHLIKITGYKPRAKRKLVRLLDPEASGPDQVSLNMVLDLLTEMTVRIRPHVIDKNVHGDRLFIFVQKNMKKRPKGFGGGPYSTSTDIAWSGALRNFIDHNKLPDFSLKTVRATMLNYVQLFNRGDLEAARQVGNHSKSIITWTHYTSDLVKRLLQEATGETLLVRERWLQSDGRLDPRAFRNWSDKGCATPGWTCLDPFDSPRPNQRKDRLCKAYGECPDCPLAAARPQNPHNVMLYEALRRAIYRSVTRVTSMVWRERWAPVVAALDGLLARVPSHVIDQSRRISVELPDIG